MGFFEQLPLQLHFPFGNGLPVVESLGVHPSLRVGHFHRLASLEGRVSDAVFRAELCALHPMQADAGLSANHPFVDAVEQFPSFMVKEKADFFQAVKKAFPTLNLNWLITGQGEIWDGPPPTGLKDIQPPSSTALNQEFFNQLLVQKLKEVARELKARDPEAYRKLGLEELIDKADGKV